MTLAAVEPWIAYSGTGTRGPFAFRNGVDVPFVQTSDVTVKRIDANGNVSTLTSGVHFDWTTSTDAASSFLVGSITLRASQAVLSTTERIVLYREKPGDQSFAQEYQQRFDSTSFNRALDRIVMDVQEADRRGARALKLPTWESAPTDLPGAQQRANKPLTFNSLGAPQAAELVGVSQNAYADFVEFIATAGQTQFVLLNQIVATKALVIVNVAGVEQGPDDYDVATDGVNTTVTLVVGALVGQSVLIRITGASLAADWTSQYRDRIEACFAGGPAVSRSYLGADGARSVNVMDWRSQASGDDWTTPFASAIAALNNVVSDYGEGRLFVPPQSFSLENTLVLPAAGKLEARGATFVIRQNVDVIQGTGGSAVYGFPTIDCTQSVGWNKNAVYILGDPASSRYFNEGVYQVFAKGAEGIGTGRAVYMYCPDDGVNNAWLVGTSVDLYVYRFETALEMRADGSDLDRTFCNGCKISIRGGSSRKSLVQTPKSGGSGGVNGNRIFIDMQSPVTASQTVTALQLAGKYNFYSIAQWDWVGGSGGTVAAATYDANMDACDIEYLTPIAPAFITDNSNSRNLRVTNLTPTRGLGAPQIYSGTSDQIIRAQQSSLRFDNTFGIRLQNPSGASDWLAFYTDANGDTLVQGANEMASAGGNINYNTRSLDKANAPSSYTITNGGSGYAGGGSAVYSNVLLVYVSGPTAATYPRATITVTNGVVTSVALGTELGAGLSLTTVLSASASSLGGGGSGFTCTPAALASYSGGGHNFRVQNGSAVASFLGSKRFYFPGEGGTSKAATLTNPSTVAAARTIALSGGYSGSPATAIIPVLRASAPSSSTDTGQAGAFAADSSYFYFAVADNTWVRWSITSTWP